jgi:hypothetical protein
MFKKIKSWLLPLSDGLKYDAVDRDGDGRIQEGTRHERRVVVVKKATAKKAPAKKKAPVKKKPATKKPVKKTTKKK